MPAKKKTSKKKAATRRPAPQPANAALEQTLERIDARLAAVENRPESSQEEVAAAIRSVADAFREAHRARQEQQTQTPWVMAGLVGILIFTVAILGWNDVLSGGTVAVLLTGSVGYALYQLKKSLG